MNEHTVKSYEDEFKLLDRRIAQMGGYAEKLLVQAMDALERRDPKLAETAVASDVMLDQLEREVQEQVIVMIARRQPLANDLRHIMTVLKIAGDLERIGDLAKNIAKRALAVAGETYPKPLMTGMRHMTEMVQTQLKDVLDALTSLDADKAMKVWHSDQQVDAMYNSLFRELLTYMMEDPRNIGTLHALPVRRQEHRAHRRPHDEHRREHLLPRPRRSDRRRPSERRQDVVDADHAASVSERN